MAHTRRTLALDRSSWDLTLDGSGRIAVAHGDYATAQNVANEARLFTDDAYFNQDKGTPYFAVALGKRANLAVIRAYLRRAALRVPDVKEVLSVEIYSLGDAVANVSERSKIPETRAITGDIQFTTVEGGNDGAVKIDI